MLGVVDLSTLGGASRRAIANRIRARCHLWRWSVMALLILPAPASATTLLEATAHALKSNPEVLAALENQRAVRNQIDGARAGYLPTLDTATAYGREWSNNTTTRGLGLNGLTLTNGQSSITLSQLLYDAGTTAANSAKAQAAYASATFGFHRVAEALLQSATDAYLESLKQQELLALLQDNVRLHQDILEKIQAKFKSGAGNEADVQQTETRLALVSANRVATLGALRIAEARYLRITGLPPRDLLRPEVHLAAIPVNWDVAEAAALQSHPAILAVQQDLAAAQHDLEAIKGSFRPNIKMDILYGNNANQSGTVGYAQNVSALVKMNYNLFRGGADNARKHESMQRITQMQQVLEQTRRTVRETLRTAWEGLEAARDRLEFLEKHVAISSKVSAAYGDQFKIGKRTLLDVLNSETELFTAKSTLTTEQFNLLANAFRVMGGMGKLQEFLGVQNPHTDPATTATPALPLPVTAFQETIARLASDSFPTPPNPPANPALDGSPTHPNPGAHPDPSESTAPLDLDNVPPPDPEGIHFSSQTPSVQIPLPERTPPSVATPAPKRVAPEKATLAPSSPTPEPSSKSTETAYPW
ncbi:MAG: TolC family outer membrane protein [Magnetococcales bacterium]|nr:TolC family outer membrane protein [Magnetococcales bacterium]